MLREIEFVASTGSGQISLSEEVANPATRDRYLVNSLIEESIRSSQLEGAATTRLVAKDMIRSGPAAARQVRAHDRQQLRGDAIHVGELRSEPLTPELICELHRIVTAGTLDDPEAAGRFQRPDEDRVGIYAVGEANDDDVLYQPPAGRAAAGAHRRAVRVRQRARRRRPVLPAAGAPGDHAALHARI